MYKKHNEGNDLISIIIPLYKVRIELLINCLQSIERQKFDNFEVLIVCNGMSKEESEEIKIRIFNYDIKIRKKIRFLWISEKGVSYARNYGVKKSCGEFITFVDADDIVNGNFLVEAIEILKSTDVDFVSGGIRIQYLNSFWDNSSKNEKIKIYKKDDFNKIIKTMLTFSDYSEFEELIGYGLSSPCAKLYRKDFITNFPFNTFLYKYEDWFFIFQLFLFADSIAISSNIWYTYYQYRNSSIHRPDRRIMDNHLYIINQIENVMQLSDNFEHIQYFTIALLGEIVKESIKFNKKNFYDDLKIEKKFNNYNYLLDNFENNKLLNKKQKRKAALLRNGKIKKLQYNYKLICMVENFKNLFIKEKMYK